MKLFTLPLVIAALSSPAWAQMPAHQDHGDHQAHENMDHENMDHGTMDHADHDHAMHADADKALDKTATLHLADTPELATALAKGGEPIVAKVLGAVCDFCAVAMNKTFGKRDEVAAVHVDLDEKTLNLVLKPGATMDAETLINLVKKSGYKVDEVSRGDALRKS
jgi:copper chaperone CopZ